jgi:hypothetical protein
MSATPTNSPADFKNADEAATAGREDGAEFRKWARDKFVEKKPGIEVPDDYPPMSQLDYWRKGEYEDSESNRKPESPFYSEWKAAFEEAYQGLP